MAAHGWAPALFLPVAGFALVLAMGGPPGPQARSAAPGKVEELCSPEDPELAELSGLAADDQRWFAVPDGGSSLRVWVLNPADCAELDVMAVEVNPYDIEDLALAPDSALWLADIGDNSLRRSTVAMHRLTPDGDATLYRLSYPDGPHDAEALLLDRAGVPHVVTKELGPARVYRPAGPLAEAGPTPLEQVATVRIEPTDTPGGPVGRVGSTLVTGGAVSADGRVVALRTYTDAYLYFAPDGDVVAALSTTPIRIPLPDEPQGEAIAFTPDGILLSGSESPPEVEGNPSIRAVPAAVALVGAPAATGTRDDDAARAQARDDAEGRDVTGPSQPTGASHEQSAETGGGWRPWHAGVIATGLGMVALLMARQRRRGHPSRPVR